MLKTVGPEAAQETLAFVSRNKHFLIPWEPRRSPDYYTLDYQQAALIQEAESMQNGQLHKVWLYKPSLPGTVIGSVALSNIIRGAFQSCHIGYRIDEREQGKGYMTEALAAVIRHAFDAMGLHRLEANIMPRNGASLQVVRKLGFYEEGLALRYLQINGVREDHLHMVLRNRKMEP